jgi:hypothetical protein
VLVLVFLTQLGDLPINPGLNVWRLPLKNRFHRSVPGGHEQSMSGRTQIEWIPFAAFATFQMRVELLLWCHRLILL